MNALVVPFFRRAALCLLATFLCAAFPAAAAEVQIVVTDLAGVGFNDPTPATPVGGNVATTIGAQRLAVFREAARIWGALLPSDVVIRVDSSFQPLPCSASTAVLGSAGATTVHANFAGALIRNTWYNKALADKLARAPVGTGSSSIEARFNSELGKTGCLTNTFFYLGLDTNHGANEDLLTVVLHEFGHGLGFTSVAEADGTFLGSGSNQFPGAYDRFLLDTATGKTWDQMTDAERTTSGTNTGMVVWTGAAANAYAKAHNARPRLVVTAPAAVAGTYTVGTAGFGLPLSSPGITAQVAAALDASDGAGPTTTDACSAITNGAVLSGKIALVDRGTCPFILKARNVQDAGAVGMIVANNVAGSPAGMGGSDPAVAIPSVMISQADGALLRGALPGVANIGVDPTQPAGADSSGRLLAYAPNPYEGGSSISHWDISAFPNLLMEPNINGDLGLSTDATLGLMRDIGWFEGSLALPTTWILPSSAHAQGANNAFFTTSLTVANTGPVAANLVLKFLGHDQNGSGGAEVTRSVPAGATTTFSDVLGSLFGVSSGFGAIRIDADTNNLKIVSQTSTPPPSGVGTFGQAVPAQTGNDLVTTAAPKALLSLRQDAAFRTNAVLANATALPTHVDLLLKSAAGATLATGTADLLPYEMRQIGTVITNLGGSGLEGTTNATLVVSTPTADARIATYAAVIDQKTNDPRTVLPVTLGKLGANGVWLLPSSAHAQGANNAFFTTDVAIANTGSTAASVTLKFLGHDQDGRAGAEVIRTIPANSSVTYTDVLGSLFGVSSGFGAILFTSNSASLKILSQTSTPPPDLLGTFGQSVPAAGAADLAMFAEPKTLVGLRQDASFRTNAVIANATDRAAHVDLVLRSETGATLATGTADLQPYEMRQIGTVITNLGGPGLEGTANATLTVSTTTAGARIATYAAIIDQKTNDPRTVLP